MCWFGSGKECNSAGLAATLHLSQEASHWISPPQSVQGSPIFKRITHINSIRFCNLDLKDSKATTAASGGVAGQL
jgi:hypothetical protein